jgi:hypothetical protein
MTPDEFRAICERLDESLLLTRGHLAAVLDVAARELRGWGTGRSAVPPLVASWLRRLDAWLRENPVPMPPSRKKDVDSAV